MDDEEDDDDKEEEREYDNPNKFFSIDKEKKKVVEHRRPTCAYCKKEDNCLPIANSGIFREKPLCWVCLFKQGGNLGMDKKVKL